MKKSLILFAIVGSIGSLYGMEIEQQNYMTPLLAEIKEQVILHLKKSDSVVGAIKNFHSIACVDKESVQFINHPQVMRQIIRTLAQEFKQSTEEIAKRFNTLAARNYSWFSHILFNVSTAQEVQPLVDQGADVNFFNIFYQTPLMSAMLKNRSVEVVKQLISAGAQVNVQDTEGDTPLILFMSGLSKLIDNGYSFWVHESYRNRIVDVDIERKKEILMGLLNAGSDLAILNKKGETALDIANSLVNKYKETPCPWQWLESIRLIRQLLEDETVKRAHIV